MKKNKVKLFLCLCVLLGIIGGVIYFICTTKQEDKQGEIDVKYEKMNMITNFRLGIAKYDNMNPHITQNKDIVQIASLIFEPLLTITQDYRIENYLAKEWSKVSNKSYIIKLKENVKWQDNSDFTAEDVKFTIEEIKKSKKSIYLENVKDIQKVEVVDNYTIRLELKNEIPFWEYRLIFPIISKKQYEEVGGLDEEFKVALNDVDFCLKLREKGYLNIFTPFAELFHYESQSRGRDDDSANKTNGERYEKECARFREKWKKHLEKGDPYFNVNFSLDYSNYVIGGGEHVKSMV